MSWSYRIIRHHQPNEWFGLHEVFYDETGKPDGMTEEPVRFVSDGTQGPEEVIGAMEMALADASALPVLDENEIPLPCQGAPVDPLDGDDME